MGQINAALAFKLHPCLYLYTHAYKCSWYLCYRRRHLHDYTLLHWKIYNFIVRYIWHSYKGWSRSLTRGDHKVLQGVNPKSYKGWSRSLTRGDPKVLQAVIPKSCHSTDNGQMKCHCLNDIRVNKYKSICECLSKFYAFS